MARPKKATVDYFPFYAKDGKTLFILESKYGCRGTGFFTNVLRFLCLTPDHHYCVSGGRNSDRLYFFSKLHCDEESGMDMLNIMAETGKINKDLWFQHGVIFSEDLINSISDAYRKRDNKPLTISQVREVYGLSAEEIEKPAEETGGNGITDGNNPQRKEKKRKEKKKTMGGVGEKGEVDQEGLALFETFWKSYPERNGKKLDKPECLSLFAHFKNGDQEQVFIALENYKQSERVKRGYPVDPARFLRAGHWKDWLTPETVTSSWFDT